MLIVCTHDVDIINWTNNPNSGASAWGHIYVLNGALNQANATIQLQGILATLGANEPLCLSAHGNDTEIGDEGAGPHDWGWTDHAIANMLPLAPHNPGVILIRACAHQVSNFSAHLAVALDGLHRLNHLWIYGYNVAIPINRHYPSPATLHNQVDLQGTQVVY
jgi:hypothetical protein